MSFVNDGVPNHFLVIVPGYGGSKLRDKTNDKMVWGDFNTTIPPLPKFFLFNNWLNNLANTLKYPNNNLEPAGIMDEVVFIQPWAKQRHYGRLLTALSKMGYRANQSLPEAKRDVYAFAYDWRQDNRTSGKELGKAIEHWRQFHPKAEVWIIAHSNGGLVSRWYIEKQGGKQYVQRLFLMGAPWHGTPKALRVLFDGLDILLLRRFNWFCDIPKLTREMFRTFPSIYQLIPTTTSFFNQLNGQKVSPHKNLNWLPKNNHPLVQDAELFNKQLGTTPSVETFCFFGSGRPTTRFGFVEFGALGVFERIEWKATDAGDGTIPEDSATNPLAKANLPYSVDHGNIYVDEDVLEKLGYELYRKFCGAVLAGLITDQLKLGFEADQDVYTPGEQIKLRVTINENTEESLPVSGAAVEVELNWEAPLPSSGPATSPSDLPNEHLWQKKHKGCYEGHLVAPSTEGYYELRATIHVTGKQEVMLEELIAVEAEPESSS